MEKIANLTDMGACKPHSLGLKIPQSFPFTLFDPGLGSWFHHADVFSAQNQAGGGRIRSHVVLIFKGLVDRLLGKRHSKVGDDSGDGLCGGWNAPEGALLPVIRQTPRELKGCYQPNHHVPAKSPQLCPALCNPMDGDCSQEMKRRLLLGRKAMTNLDSILKNRGITLLTKVHLVKAMVFPVVMYGCESWTIKKAECRRIYAFELRFWRRLLRIR